jgi:hypothetical protein
MDTDEHDDRERRVDDTVNDSFPASDPPAHAGLTGTRKGEAKRPPSNERGDKARPTGTPTSERHETETAHQWEDETGR